MQGLRAHVSLHVLSIEIKLVLHKQVPATQKPFKHMMPTQSSLQNSTAVRYQTRLFICKITSNLFGIGHD